MSQTLTLTPQNVGSSVHIDTLPETPVSHRLDEERQRERESKGTIIFRLMYTVGRWKTTGTPILGHQVDDRAGVCGCLDDERGGFGPLISEFVKLG